MSNNQYCNATTVKGNRCKHFSKKNGLCWMHYGHFKRSPDRQCTAITQKGTRCKRNGLHSSGLCRQHLTPKKPRRKRVVLEKPEECPICYISLNKNDKPLACGHWFHSFCLEDWKKIEKCCPMCRAVIT